MSVELDPSELGFRRPFTSEVSQTLRLKNPHSDPVAFKVKTTAPRQYCVRPNSGKIDPHGEVEVQVLLQAMPEDPPLDAKCKDKFLVQSVQVTSDRDASVAAIWQNIEQTSRSSIQEKKIRVTFLPAAGAGTPATPAKKQVNGVPHLQSTPSQQSPDVSTFTPQATTSSAADAPVSGNSSATQSQTIGGTVAATAAGAAATVQSAARSTVNAIPTSQEELKQQLAAAQSQIEQLRKQVADGASGLRQRNAGGSGSGSGSGSGVGDKLAQSPAVQKLQQAPGGVPVQVVAILCLISFILAYLLF